MVTVISSRVPGKASSLLCSIVRGSYYVVLTEYYVPSKTVATTAECSSTIIQSPVAMSYGVPILVNIEILHGSLKALICLLITEYLNRLVLCAVSQSRAWEVLQPSPALNALSPNPVCQQETPETTRPEPKATEAAKSILPSHHTSL